MSITPLTITGVSKFSSDFQTILTRAVNIAALPVKALQNRQADLTQEKMLLSSLSQSVGTLASSVGSVASLGDNSGLSASSSSWAIASASVSSGAQAAGNYQISEVTSLARAASEISLSGLANADTAAVSSTGSLQLTVGGTVKTITLAAGQNNLNGLRDAINGLNAGVTATVLNTGSGSTPYYLALSANSTGATTLTLKDDPSGANTNLLSQTNQGSNAQFKLNGLSVSKTSNSISDLVAGVTFNINGLTTATNPTADITLTSSPSPLISALQAMVNNYNSTASQVNGQIGPAAGLLSGNSIIREVRNAMFALTGYGGTGNGTFRSLADLGISMSTDGVMSLDSTVLSGMTSGQLVQAYQFIGSSSTGLKQVKDRMTAISDPVTGTAILQENGFDDANKRISTQVNLLTDRINLMQVGLQQKLQAADTLLAGLESQQSMLTSQVSSLSFVTYGKVSS